MLYIGSRSRTPFPAFCSCLWSVSTQYYERILPSSAERTSIMLFKAVKTLIADVWSLIPGVGSRARAAMPGVLVIGGGERLFGFESSLTPCVRINLRTEPET